ncbi:fimbrial protein [Haemophilus influenzae]|uniref:fimbrial protein n=1 Tax=Haemophilus influenzae TaxID=727 RepID=UPI000D4EDE4B|nr:Major fimbrial subunit precursor [Haemophilus influenzae]
MKKTLLGSLILLAFAGNVQAAANTETSGKVTFFGKVVENTCKVKSENRDMNVVLNDVGKSHLKNKGDTAMPTPFTITLTDCATTGAGDTKAKKVGIYFYSWENADKDNNYTLKNMTGVDKAQKVNIQLFKENGVDAIKVVGKNTDDFTHKNGGSSNSTKPTENHISASTTLTATTDIPLHFIAQYYSTENNTVTAGKVQTSVDFQIAYE